LRYPANHTRLVTADCVQIEDACRGRACCCTWLQQDIHSNTCKRNNLPTNFIEFQMTIPKGPKSKDSKLWKSQSSESGQEVYICSNSPSNCTNMPSRTVDELTILLKTDSASKESTIIPSRLHYISVCIEIRTHEYHAYHGMNKHHANRLVAESVLLPKGSCMSAYTGCHTYKLPTQLYASHTRFEILHHYVMHTCCMPSQI
jgi:hypothetical protein